MRKKKGRFTARSNGLMDREKTERLAWSSQLDYFRLIRQGRIGRTRACRQNDCCSEPVSLGRATIQVRLAIHTFRNHPRPWRDARLSDFQHRPVNDAQPFLCLFILSTVIFVVALSMILFIVDVLLPRMLSRAETYWWIFFISFDNDAMLNVARKLRLIARKYT